MTDLIPARRTPESREDRMRHATANPTIEAAHVDGFNGLHPIGTPVRYWKGAREGAGKVSRTRTAAQLLSGHTAVVWLENVSGCIALTHVEPITEKEIEAAPAEQWASAATGRSFRTYQTAAERDRLDAEVGRLQDELDEMRDARDVLRHREQLLLDVLRHREQLLLDVMRRVVEDLDRALAHYETQPEPASPVLGSPAARAQDEPA